MFPYSISLVHDCTSKTFGFLGRICDAYGVSHSLPSVKASFPVLHSVPFSAIIIYFAKT